MRTRVSRGPLACEDSLITTKQFVALSILFFHPWAQFPEMGPFIFSVQMDWFDCTVSWPSLFSPQHPCDCIPSSTRVATLQSVRLLWAADRGPAQAASPGPLWDGGQPWCCQSPDRRPPCGAGMDSNSLTSVLYTCRQKSLCLAAVVRPRTFHFLTPWREKDLWCCECWEPTGEFQSGSGEVSRAGWGNMMSIWKMVLSFLFDGEIARTWQSC